MKNVHILIGVMLLRAGAGRCLHFLHIALGGGVDDEQDVRRRLVCARLTVGEGQYVYICWRHREGCA